VKVGGCGIILLKTRIEVIKIIPFM